jgi:putative flippase GtrA
VSSLSEQLAARGPAALQLARFSVVGGLGTVTNLVLFFLLVDLGGVPPLAGATLCFAVAVTQNYVLNEIWTFATGSEDRSAGWARRFSFERYAKFVVASLLGFGINASVLMGLLWLYDFPLALIPQAIGIAAGMAFNFVASRRVVFRRN